MVITVASEKGGVGKTTLAVQFAIMLAQQKHDVLLVDADPQRSALEVAGVRAEEGHLPTITAVALGGKTLNAEVKKLIPKYDHIVIDVGGRDSIALRCSMLVSDHVLIPILPGQLDAWTLENFDTLVEQGQAFNPKLQAWLVLNKVDTNPAIKIAEEVIDFAKDLKNIKTLKSKIGYRVAYRRCVAEGLAVNEMSKRDVKAMNEIDTLFREVLSNGSN